MSLSRKTAVPVLLVLLAAAGCTREERTITAHSRAVTVDRPGAAPDVVVMEGRIWDTAMAPDAFDAAWGVVTRRAAPYDAFMITLERVREGIPGESDLLVGLVLAVPLPLVAGVQYPIGHAFAPPSDMPLYWRFWGRRDLQTRGTAEVSLRMFDYRAVGMRIENEFIATAATGTIRVVTSNREQVVLRLDLTATNAAGERALLSGDIDIRAERYRPPIT
jgi:hypothetical protein